MEIGGHKATLFHVARTIALFFGWRRFRYSRSLEDDFQEPIDQFGQRNHGQDQRCHGQERNYHQLRHCISEHQSLSHLRERKGVFCFALINGRR